ncbi:MAG: transketolase [Gemmatimonadaceae bacterium]|nr:transketolase [Gemmatimonadaceae bacterium]
MRDNFVRQLSEIARTDRRLFLMTADLGFRVLDDFATEFPRKFLNVGIAEQNMIGIATGLALEGRIVFTYSIGNFSTLRCLEQIRNDACYHGANVKVVAVGGGFSYGVLGISHHATEDLAIMRSLPDMTVVAPGDQWESREATKALFATPGACYLRLDKSAAPATARSGEVFTLGKARTVRQGSDITLAATGGILGAALEAADSLVEQGIACRVLSIHTIKPFDTESILSACRETGGIVTVEEHTIHGGLGSLVAETCLDEGVKPALFRRIGLRAGFSSVVGSQEHLRREYGMDAVAIAKAVAELLSAGSPRSPRPRLRVSAGGSAGR